MSAKSVVRIELLGTSFSIRSDEPQEYVRQVIRIVEDTIAQVRKSVPGSDPLRVMIVSALNVADQLMKERAKRSAGDALSESAEVEEIALRLIGQIDETLQE